MAFQPLNSPVGSVIRFTREPTLIQRFPSQEMLVLVVWSDAVAGLTRAGAPSMIRNADIIRAEIVVPGPEAAPDPLVRTYYGEPGARAQYFQGESALLQHLGYQPTAQTVNEGQHGVLTLLLCFVLIGFLILLLSHPEGSLTVTYRRVAQLQAVPPEPTKTCPRCAETIKAAAVACRYCGYEYPTI